VEQLFFLNQLDNYSSTKNFKSILGEVENKLVAEKFMSRTTPQTQGRLVQLWHRYKKDIAVAASIAGIVSLFVGTIVSSVNKSDPNIALLTKKIDAQADETRKIKTELKKLPTSVTVPVKQAAHHLIVENNKGVEFDATAIYVNVDQDLAIIKITDSSFKHLAALPYTIRKSGANLGEAIFLMGYPKAEIVYGEGYVSARNGYKMDTTYCQISTSANEGNSGSPVITKNGDLIGVIASKETDATGVVFAIKSANIYRAISEAKKQKDDVKIKITSAPSLKGLDRETQIKKMEGYVFMIKGN
jgi:serine protease Do